MPVRADLGGALPTGVERGKSGRWVSAMALTRKLTISSRASLYDEPLP